MTSPFVDRVEYQVIGRDNNASKVFRDVATAADGAGDSVDGLDGHIDRLNRNIDATAVRMRALISLMRGISDVDMPNIGFGDIDTAALERANKQLAGLVVAVDKTGEATVQLGSNMDNATRSISAVGAESGRTVTTISTLGRDFDTLSSSVDGSRNGITGISTDFRTLGQSVEDGRVVVIKFHDDLSTLQDGRSNIDNLGAGFKNLSTDIETSRGHVGDLARELERAKDINVVDHINISKNVVETVSSDRDRLERAGLAAGAAIGGGLLLALSDTIGGGIANIPIVGPLMTAVVAAVSAISATLAAVVAGLMAVVAAAAAVTLVSALGAAVLAAFAGGAILAGILLQLRDPAIKAAFADTGRTIVEQFQKATAAFAPAVQSALGQVRAAVQGMGPQLQAFFTAAASYVEPLTAAILGFVQSALPGATKAMEGMKPVINELAKWMPKLGQTIGDFFERLSKNAPDLATGLGYVLGAVNEAIKFFGVLIEQAAMAMGPISDLWNLIGKFPFKELGSSLGDVFRGFTITVVQGGDAVGDVLNGIKIKAGDLFEYLNGPEVKGSGANVERGFKPLEKAKEYVAGLADKTRDLAKATQEALNAANQFIGLGDSQSAMYKAMREGAEHLAKATGKDLKAGIDLSSEAGSKNWQVLANIASSANRASQQVIDMKGSTADAAAVMGVARKKFIEVAMGMNMSADQARILADKMFGIPDVDPKVSLQDKASKGIGGVDAKLNALDKKNAMPSVGLLDNASRGIGQIQNLLYRLDGNSATVHVNVQADKVPSGLQYAASGGPVYGPGPKGVDSKLYMLAPGEHVLTAAEVDAAGGHQAVMAFRRSLLNKGGAATAGSDGGGGDGWSSRMDARTFGEAMRRALSGMTLTIDDRTGRTAQLIARGG